jgi:hypothetical protein
MRRDGVPPSTHPNLPRANLETPAVLHQREVDGEVDADACDGDGDDVTKTTTKTTAAAAAEAEARDVSFRDGVERGRRAGGIAMV